jgi:hypothetical protein
VVGVRVRNYNVTHGADFAGGQRKPDAAPVNREAIVNEKGGQTLELRLWSGAARQKSDSHPRCLRLSHSRPTYYTTVRFSICDFLFAIFYFLFFIRDNLSFPFDIFNSGEYQDRGIEITNRKSQIKNSK